MFFPIICKTLIEVCIFLFGDSISLADPNGFIFINVFEFCGYFLYLFLFLFLLLFFLLFLYFYVIFLFVFIFSRFFSVLVFFLVTFFFIIRDFFFIGFLDLELNLERDEFRMLFNEILKSALFKEFQVVTL